MAEQKTKFSEPRPTWSSKKYKNYGEFNKAVLEWRKREFGKDGPWKKKDIKFVKKDGKIIAIDTKNNNKPVTWTGRGLPGFISDHLMPGIKYNIGDHLVFSEVPKEGSGWQSFLTISEARKRRDEKLHREASSREEKEDFEWGAGGQPSATSQLAKQNPIDKFANFEEKGAHEWGGGEQPSASEQLRIIQGDPSARDLGEDEAEAFEWGEEGQPDASMQLELAGDATNWSSDVTDSGSNKSRSNRTSSRDNIGPSTGRSAMRAANVERFGEAHVSHLEKKNTAFQAMKRGEITKEQFIEDFPKSQTAKAFRKKKLKIKK